MGEDFKENMHVLINRIETKLMKPEKKVEKKREKRERERWREGERLLNYNYNDIELVHSTCGLGHKRLVHFI